MFCCLSDKTIASAPVEVIDSSPTVNTLSHVGEAAYDVLRKKHGKHHHSLWNVTSGKMIGSLDQTPNKSFWDSVEDPVEGHADWFPEKMCEIMSKTKKYCDFMSLGAPDGLFMDKMKEGLKNICENSVNNDSDEPIIVRFMFGNIIGLPINCNKVMKALTEDLPPTANIQVWVGAWRHGTSWNHAKLIAVDGRYLHTGGHNVWSDIYINDDPVHDLSLEMEGEVGHDGHMYANGQWDYIQTKQSSWIGQIVENVPDFLPLVAKSRVTVSEYPRGKALEFPPTYVPSLFPTYEEPSGSTPVISVGRHGAMIEDDRPADDAFIAMIDSSKKIIRMSLQDVGPICLPGTKIPLPGVSWPKPLLDALARAIWLRGVDIEIVLSNVGSRRGYTNGWTCVDVGSEIIKRIEKQFPNALDSELRQKVEDNLRICYIRHAMADAYQSGEKIGNHTKFFIVDDVASYTGSQNLYVADLGEWGVIIDNAAKTEEMMTDYWNPMWNASYIDTDCDVQEVMDGLKIDRDGEVTHDKRKLEEAEVAVAAAQLPPRTEMYDKE